ARAQIHRADELKPGREPHAAGRARDDELAVLERLAQRFERRTLELRQLVEQQHSSMRQAGLAGPQSRPAADDRRCRRAVMRRAKRRVADQWMVRIDEACDRVDAGDLECLLLLERRQDPRQSPGEHRLSGARRPTEQQIVTAGRRQLECTPSTLLAADVGEIERAPTRLAVADDVLGRLELAAEIRDRVRKVAYTDGLDARQGGLRARLVRTDDPLELGA